VFFWALRSTAGSSSTPKAGEWMAREAPNHPIDFLARERTYTIVAATISCSSYMVERIFEDVLYFRVVVQHKLLCSLLAIGGDGNFDQEVQGLLGRRKRCENTHIHA
jgi:hypothetical protein